MQSNFMDLKQHLIDNQQQWLDYFTITQTTPSEIPENLLFYKMNSTQFQKLLVYRCFQPTKLDSIISLFIRNVLGGEFIDAPTFDLNSAFGDSTCCKPLLFILTSNYNPIKSIQQFAETQSIDDNRLKVFSMGQQQGSFALKSIEDAVKSGEWVILQNVHLAGEWMHVLERICVNLAPDTTHPDFRLWITSKPMTSFPLSILQCSIKLVNESMQQSRAFLLHTFSNRSITNENWINNCKKPIQLKQLLYSLSVFHATVLERRNFNSLGWNYSYDFNDIDFHLSVYQLYQLLNEFQSIPFEILQILLAECNYGGHIADIYDSRCLHLLSKYFCSKSCCDNGKPMNSATLNIDSYFPTNYSTMDSIRNYVKTLTHNDGATICGLHRNADIIKDKNETRFIIDTILLTQVNLTLFSEYRF